MEIKIQKDELLKVLKIIETGLNEKTVIESLKGIKIEAANNVLTFTASKTDLVIEYILNEGFEIISNGTIIIPGSQFNTIVKKTTDDTFLIREDENGVLLKTEKSKINLLQYDVASYPHIKFETNNMSHFETTTNLLHKAFNHTRHAVASNTIKPILSGINFKVNNNEMVVGATDARRLAISTLTLDKSISDSIEFCIPRNLLGDVIKVLDSAFIEGFELYANSNQIILSTQNLKVKTRLLEGDYPSIERLIPSNETYSYIVKSKDISAVIEKVILLSNKEGSNLTTKIEGDNLIISSFIREIGSLEEIVELKEINGSPFTISFDPNFLSSAISAISESELELKMVDEVSAFSITGLKNKNNIQVISPIKLS